MRNRLGAFIYTILSMLLLVSFGTGQEKMRTIEHSKYKSKNEPITIGYEIGDKQFLRGVQVGSPDWLKELTLNIKNTSKKTITYFQIELVVEKQGEMPVNWSFVVRFPESSQPVLDAAGKLTGESRLPTLSPGETVRMMISENQLRGLDELKKQGVNDIETVSIDIRYVYYDDDTGWSLGHEVKRDPNNTNRWIPADGGLPKPAMIHRFATRLGSFLGNTAGQTLAPFYRDTFAKTSIFFATPTLNPSSFRRQRAANGGRAILI